MLRKEVVKDGKSEGFKPKAEVFITSYTLDDAEPGSRPVTFAFNGGPGSSSIWLHLGLLGPRRVLSGDAGAPAPPPYGLADNPETLLAHSDLVFIDPVSTGYSRAAEGGKTKDFHGFKGDIESVGELIRLWVSRHERWLSPKFLAGESYGTLRAAGLAEHLQERYGLYLNGLLLISSVLDLGTLRLRPRATTCRTRCTCRRTPPSRTTTACTASARSTTCSPTPRTSRRRTCRGRSRAAPGCPPRTGPRRSPRWRR